MSSSDRATDRWTVRMNGGREGRKEGRKTARTQTPSRTVEFRPKVFAYDRTHDDDDDDYDRHNDDDDGCGRGRGGVGAGDPKSTRRGETRSLVLCDHLPVSLLPMDKATEMIFRRLPSRTLPSRLSLTFLTFRLRFENESWNVI